MKSLYLFILMIFAGSLVAQNTVKGVITDSDTKEPLIGATVMVQGTTNGTVTATDGSFQLSSADADGNLVISYIGYDNMTVPFGGEAGYNLTNLTLGSSAMSLGEVVITGVMDIVQDRRTPVAVSTINAREIQAKGVGNVEFPELMKNTPSVYVSNQQGFGDSQMFLRGFDQTNTAFLLNGQPINGMEDGRMYWSNWSGMSDVADVVQIQRGLGSSKLAISSVGGTVNIVTKTTALNKGGFARFMTGFGKYFKGTVAYNTGLQNKWAFSFLLDHWQGDRKFAEGTRGQGQNYFASIGFKPNDDHTFNFLITGAPQWHGQRWSQKEEDLEEDPTFNQHWGMDGDDWQTERRNFYHKPVINLNWDWNVSDQSKLSSVLYASFGRGGGTGNYGSNRVRTEEGQVDFTAIRADNTADTDGIGEFSDNYALRASMNNHQWFGNVTNYQQRINDNFSFNVGADFRFYTGDHFRQLVDMFGLNSWNESFRHATRPSNYQVTETFAARPWAALFNFADEGQRIAYDYSETINYQGAFGQLEYENDIFTAFVQGSASNQSYQREGRWSDIGESEKISKVGYNVKAGTSVGSGDWGTIFVNAGHYSRQPFLDNVFSNIRYSNDLIQPDVENEKINGLEAGYKFQNRKFSANVNLYSTTWENRTVVSVFTNDNGTPDDEDDDFAQRNVERGIGQSHKGVEVDLQYLMNKMRIRAFASLGDWTYNEIETVDAYNDDTGALIETSSGQDISGVHITNAPQMSAGLGIRYEIIQGLSVDADLNYFAKNYRRGRNFDQAIVVREEFGELPVFNLIDAGASYNFNLGGQSFILRANVFNLLDHYYINQTDPFGSLNGNGRTWNASIKMLF